MPLNGGNYVAPKWVDYAAPALDAKELQAMCDSIVKNQTEANKVPGLQSLINGKARAQMISYVGSGIYGSGNPCSITAEFPIKVAIMLGFRINSSGVYSMVAGGTNVVSETLTGSFRQGNGFYDRYNQDTSYAKISNGDKTISWYNTSGSQEQQNLGGLTFFVLCIGQ